MQPPFTTPNPFEVFDRIGHVNFVALDLRFFERTVEQTTGGSDEGMTLPVFLISRLFADKYHARPSRTFAKNRLSGVFIKVAALAMLGGLAQRRHGALRW